MLRSLKDLEQYAVNATDGAIGTVVNFLVDDERWVLRYLVVDTDSFLDRRRVLISPISFRQVAWSTHSFHLALTKDKVENSPSVDVEEPVSRLHERDYYHYYGYTNYWGSPGLWGPGNAPSALATDTWTEAPAEHGDKTGDVHLRSAREVRGYHIQGHDAAIGHVEDFIIDDETWEVRYLVIDTSNWWFGKKVLVVPHWASSISWKEKRVTVDLSRQAIKDSPEWNATAAVDREYETRLYEYYRRPVYWDDRARPAGAPPEHKSGSPPS